MNPSQVQEIEDALGEVFTIDLDPYWKLRDHKLSGLREDLIGLVRTGEEKTVRALLEEVVAEYGEEGARQRAEVEAIYWQAVDEERRAEEEQ